MLRALAVAVLLANVLFFAWARGWMSPAVPGPHDGEREPERLARQVHPEFVQVLTAQAASAALRATAPAAALCFEAGPLGEAEIAAAESALAIANAPPGSWRRDTVQPSAAWLVYMGRFTDAATLRTKENELRRLKLDFEVIQTPSELTPGLALSRSDSRAAADASLAQMVQHGVHSARVVALPTPRPQYWLRVPKADAELQARLRSLKAPQIARPFNACAQPP